MFEQLLAWDKSLFLLINSCNSDFFDGFFWIFTQKETWIPFYVALLYLIIKTKRKESSWIILGLLLTIVLSDQLSSSLIKPLVERLRPSHNSSLSELIHLVNGYKAGRFGFVSSHAANSFGLALFASLLFKKRYFTLTVFCWAILNSYSRIYIGVHFPGDIIGGAVIGILSAWFVYFLLKKMKPIIFKSSTYRAKPTKYFWDTEKLLVVVLGMSLLVIFVLVYFEIFTS